MNSVIQCLSNTKPIREYLLNEHLHDINAASTTKGSLIKAVGDVIGKLWTETIETDQAVDTSALKLQIEILDSCFEGNNQHDASEFLIKILHGMSEEVNKAIVDTQPNPPEYSRSIFKQ